MIDKLKELIEGSFLEDIYLTGFVGIENEPAEFYADDRFLYFEFSDRFIEFESIDQFSRLRITIVDLIRHEFELEEDMIPGKSRISQVVFKNPLADASMCFYNFEARESGVLCDALQINLSNGQNIFLDPSFLGINMGGLDVQDVWKDNLIDGIVPKKTYIDFAH
ncbi:hypothetical protein [Hazenella coriacea]|uniref:Uncharacterized protein n=1 Tax=Hazenella coriacea TaxID=1179467 RepID=A0A4R3L1I6_9BACL|nr:hypothetical protein [Hazenella coriacea]TCS92835.1 hypothetical protein EDD58_11062 [Hazenella coriacea]